MKYFLNKKIFIFMLVLFLTNKISSIKLISSIKFWLYEDDTNKDRQGGGLSVSTRTSLLIFIDFYASASATSSSYTSFYLLHAVKKFEYFWLLWSVLKCHRILWPASEGQGCGWIRRLNNYEPRVSGKASARSIHPASG